MYARKNNVLSRLIYYSNNVYFIIIKIEADIKKATNISRDFKDPNLLAHAWNRFIYENFGGETVKDKILDNKNKFYEYDKVFYDNLR